MVRVFIKTQGCSHNYSDSEHMAGLLQQAGHTVVDEEHADGADVVLLNTCTVKSPTENAFLHDLDKHKETGKKIVVGGCIPQAQPTRFKDYSTIGTRQLDNVVDIVERTAAGETIQQMKRTGLPLLSVRKKRRNHLVETIPISVGCLSACSFCHTKHARGHLQSYPVKDIVEKLRTVTNEGVKEVWLTSQDTGCYGFDHNTNAAALLNEICRIKKYFMIRFGMGNPDHLLKFTDELIEAYKDKRVYKFLHVPVQSGSNTVLKAMKRAYTVEDFKTIVTQFRAAFPHITISTDIICGFPEETEEQFNETVKLLEEVKPEIVNISRFWKRPNTVAVTMTQLPGAEIKRRSGIVTDVCHRVMKEQNKKWIGWKGRVFINEKGKNGSSVGKNFAYKQVVLKQQIPLGSWVDVVIVEVTTFDLRGEIIGQGNEAES
jgi:threonylcarbamoyladenosine tRNA methylthiotransferase CDKAL1